MNIHIKEVFNDLEVKLILDNKKIQEGDEIQKLINKAKAYHNIEMNKKAYESQK